MPTVLSRAVMAILACLLTSAAEAQSASGTIQGTVVDGSGARVSGVTVTITASATGWIRETLTDDDGFFILAALPAGTYEVQASAMGYATRRQSALTLQASQVITLRVELGVAPAPETITMADWAPMVERTRSQTGSLITTTEVDQLSARGRNAVGLALLAPGVELDAAGAPGIVGQPSWLNRIVVDGIERSRPLGGAYWVSQEATHGMTVSTSAHPAEYGRTTGGVVHVATRSGSNKVGGSAFEFYGTGADAAGSTHQFGGSFGGPLVRDRHFAFGLYDGMRRSADTTGPNTERDVLLAKTDHQFESHRLSLRYNAERWRTTVDAPDAPELSSDTITATGTSAFGRALFNESRVHVGRDRELGPTFVNARVRRLHVADTLTWAYGAHTLKAGADLQFDSIAAEASAAPGAADQPGLGEYALFVQDEWRFDEALTLNLGVRYDAQTLAARSEADDIAPRLAASWAPGVGRFVIRGGYGLLHGRTPWALLTAVHLQTSDQARLGSATALAFGTEYQNPRAHQASGGFEWEWMPNTTVSMNYIFSRADRLPRLAAASPGRTRFLESTGRSTYSGLAGELTRRFAQGHQYRLSYTLSSIDPAGTGLATPSDRRHRFAGSFAVSSNRIVERFDGVMETLVRDWMLSATYAAQTNAMRDGVRPAAWMSLDPRIARDIRLSRDTGVTVIWEAFNLLNRNNRPVLNDAFLGDVLTRVWGTSVWGEGLEYFEPRVMRFAVRLHF